MRTIRLLVLAAVCNLGISSGLQAHSTERPDTTVSQRMAFGISQSRLSEKSKEALNRLIGSVDSARRCDSLISIDITGSASPDGPEELNRRLSAERARTVRDHISKQSGIPSSFFSTSGNGEDWRLFRRLVNDDGTVPLREKLIGIIDSPISSGQKEQQMRALDGGRVWKHLALNVFPALRIATVEARFRITPPLRLVIPLPEEPDNGDDPLMGVPDTADTVPATTVREIAGTPATSGNDSIWQRHAYVKTNLPAWLMLWINAAGEIDIAPHWSAGLSVCYAGYDYFRHDLKFRNLTVMPEFRYWPVRSNDGFFIGAHFGMAYYNVAFCGERRYQDHDGNTPALGGGLSAGFRFLLPKNPRWKFEVSIGAGIYRLDYDIFDNLPNGLVTGREKRTFFGIDNAAFSIAYTFDVKKKGDRR